MGSRNILDGMLPLILDPTLKTSNNLEQVRGKFLLGNFIQRKDLAVIRRRRELAGKMKALITDQSVSRNGKKGEIMK